MKIKVEKGFINPSDGENVIVELIDGSLTGAMYKAIIGKELHSQECFFDVDCMPLYGVVDSWFPNAVEKIRNGAL